MAGASDRRFGRDAPIIFVAACVLSFGTQVSYSAPFRQWATTLTQRINREFELPSHLYAKYKTASGTVGHRTSISSATLQLRVLTAATVVAPQWYRTQMMQYASALQKYYLINAGGLWAYKGFGRGHRNQNYYGTNGEMLIALMEMYGINRSSSILSRAKDIMAFILSGEDKAQGGGIYQKVKARNKKCANSTIRAVVGGLLLYKATHQKKYLDDAHRLYAWVVDTLQAPNGLFDSNIDVRTGQIKRAVMANDAANAIIAQLLFYDISGKNSHLQSAIQMAKIAEDKFIGKSGQIDRRGKRAFSLADAFLQLYRRTGDAHWLKIVERAMTFVHQHVQDGEGHYVARWGRKHVVKALRKWSSINQACVARVYWRLAACQKPNHGKDVLTLGCRQVSHANPRS